MRLYDIAAAIEAAVQFDPETGEVTPESEAQLNALSLTKEQKCLDISAMIREMELTRKGIKTEADKLDKKLATLDERMDWLRMYLAQWMQDKESYEDARIYVRCGTSESVEITGDIPPVFLVPVAPRPDKAELKKCLKAGQDIPGATLVTKKFVTIK